MSENQEPPYETLKRRLETAETALEAVRKGQVDAIMGDRETLVIRLKETEAREAHIKQVLLAIRNVNQLIVKETDPQRLIDNACANLTETLGYHNAWIALLNEDSHVVRTAASGFDGGFEVLEDRLQAGDFPACMQQTLAQETLVVIEDPVSGCRNCPLAREYEGRAGLTRCLSHGGKTYGILSVSVPAAFAGDTEEQELFEELTDDLGFALYKIETEEALRLHSMTLNQIEDRVTVTDLEGYITYVNEAACRMLGKSREELLGQHVSVYGDDPSTGAPQEEIVQKTLQDGVWRGEVTNYRTDGTAAILDARVQVVRDETGKPVALCGISTDITDRKQAEEALLDSRMELEQILKALPDALVYADTDRRITRVNDAFVRMFGYRPEEVLGEKTGIIYAKQEEFLEQGRQRYNVQVRDKYAPYEIEYRRKNGEIFPSETVGTPVRDTQDRVIGLLGLVRDISDRKQAEEALRASELQKNLILDATAEMVAYYDLDLRVIWANRAGAESVGKSTADLVGHHCYEIWAQRNDPCPDCPVLKARDTGVAQKIERQTPDGRYWLLRGYPVLDDQGKAFALVEFGQDITEQKQAEERHVQLEEQMHQAQKLESIGLLAGGVAHDFNNMLGIIIANAELAEMRRDADGLVHQNLQEILKASHRAADTVRQLLAFARKQTISPKDLDLNETVSGILKMLRRIIGENIDLRFVPGKGLWNVRMDPAQVHQLLTNLVVNSRDALPDGGRITIETANKTMDEFYTQTHNGFVPGKYVLLMVSDTGEGMSPEVMDHLFDPFFTTKEVGRGTGLGLATVYGMVKQNHGFIYVYSEPGQGTTVKIYLPRHEGKRAEMSAAAVKKEVPGGNETILVAEDEEVLLQTCKHVLERQGYTVLAARKPGEALALAEQHPGEIHMLLTDVVMPEMNGRELAERLQALRPTTKCLFMSGYTADVVARHGVLDRGVEFIEKPFSFTELAGKVRDVLDKDIVE
ncbi:MAG: PAS domain S-box protein [Desulfobacteraceae bacterium]